MLTLSAMRYALVAGMLLAMAAPAAAQAECAAYDDPAFDAPPESCTDEDLANSIDVLTNVLPAACGGYDPAVDGDAGFNSQCDVDCAVIVARWADTVLRCNASLLETHPIEFNNGGVASAGCSGCDTAAFTSWAGVCGLEAAGGSCSIACRGLATAFFATSVDSCQLLFDVNPDLDNLMLFSQLACGQSPATDVEPNCNMELVAPPFVGTCFDLAADGASYNPCSPTECSVNATASCSLFCAGAMAIVGDAPDNYDRCVAAGQVGATEQGLLQQATFECTGCDATLFLTAASACETAAFDCADACLDAVTALMPYQSMCNSVDEATMTFFADYYTTTCNGTAVTAAGACNMAEFGPIMLDLLGLGEVPGCWCDTGLGPLPAPFAENCSPECGNIVNQAYGLPDLTSPWVIRCDHQLDDTFRLAVGGSASACSEDCDLAAVVLNQGNMDPETGVCTDAYVLTQGTADCSALAAVTSTERFLKCDNLLSAALGVSAYFLDGFYSGVAPPCDMLIERLIRGMEYQCTDWPFGVCIDGCRAFVQGIRGLGAVCPLAGVSEMIDATMIDSIEMVCNQPSGDGSCDALIDGVSATLVPSCSGSLRAGFEVALLETVPAACGYNLTTGDINAVCPSLECAARTVTHEDTYAVACADMAAEPEWSRPMAMFGLALTACAGCDTTQATSLLPDPTVSVCAAEGADSTTACSAECGEYVAGLTAQMDVCSPIFEDHPTFKDDHPSFLNNMLSSCEASEVASQPPLCDMTALAPPFVSSCMAYTDDGLFFCGPEEPFAVPTCGPQVDPSLCDLTCVGALAETNLNYLGGCTLTGQFSEVDFATTLGVAGACFGCDVPAFTEVATAILNNCTTFDAGGECTPLCSELFEQYSAMEQSCSFLIGAQPALQGFLGLGKYCERSNATVTGCDMTKFGTVMANMAGLGTDPDESCLCNTGAGPQPNYNCEDPDDQQCSQLVSAATASFLVCQNNIDILVGGIFAVSESICPTCLKAMDVAIKEAKAFCGATSETTCLLACENALANVETVFADCASDPDWGFFVQGLYAADADQFATWTQQCESLGDSGIVFNDASGASTLEGVFASALVAVVMAMLL